MEFPFYFKIEFFFDEAKTPEIIFRSIEPELNDFHQRRSKAEMLNNKNTLLLEINAKDKTALTASINSYLKQINLVCEIIGAE